jgi:hypothetical protein
VGNAGYLKIPGDFHGITHHIGAIVFIMSRGGADSVLTFALVPNLHIGNAALEAPASIGSRSFFLTAGSGKL